MLLLLLGSSVRPGHEHFALSFITDMKLLGVRFTTTLKAFDEVDGVQDHLNKAI